MLAAGLPPELAGLITKIGQGVRQGLINRDFLQRAPQVTGSNTLPDFKAAFKAAYVH